MILRPGLVHTVHIPWLIGSVTVECTHNLWRRTLAPLPLILNQQSRQEILFKKKAMVDVEEEKQFYHL